MEKCCGRRLTFCTAMSEMLIDTAVLSFYKAVFALHPSTFAVVQPVGWVTVLRIPGNLLNMRRLSRSETMEGSHAKGLGHH